MVNFVKKHWKVIGVGLFAFYLLKGCFTDPSDDLTQAEKNRLFNIAANGYGPTWESLSDDDKLKMADYILKIWESLDHIQLNIDAQDIVDRMDELKYSQNTSVVIGDEIMSILKQEEIAEGKSRN